MSAQAPAKAKPKAQPKNKGTQVAKEFSPEELSQLSNIESILADLKAGSAAPAEQPADVEMGDVDTEGMDPAVTDDEDDGVEKGIDTGDADASVGDDDAEDRLEDIPETDASNIALVAKALSALLAKPKVKKSTPEERLYGAIGQIAKVMKTVSDRQEQQDRVIKELLEGLGVSAAVAPQQKVTKQAPSQAPNPQGAVEALAQILGMKVEKSGPETVSGGSPHDRGKEVRKNMGGILQFFGADAWDEGKR